MIELIQFINKFQQLDNETEEAVKKFYVEETYKKDEYIVEAGNICTKVIFIKSGLVRRFFIHNDHDVTIWIYGSNQMATCMPSFFGQKPAYEYLQACVDTVAYSVSFEGDYKLLEYPLFAKFHIKQLRFYLAGVDEVNYRFKLMTAKEKYTFMLKYFPEIIQKAKLKHIASFLDVSQETLSRIRASIN
jgi:signal-transduction protein with cAMP-binding, CBS, and nucleotidyltransferase domain